MKKRTEDACGEPLAIGPTTLYCGLSADHREPLCKAQWKGNTFRWQRGIRALRELVTA